MNLWNWMKLTPYVLILAMAGWIWWQGEQKKDLVTQVDNQKETIGTITTTVNELVAAQARNEKTFSDLQSADRSAIVELETLAKKTETRRGVIQEIKNGREALSNDGVGDGMLYSLSKLRERYESLYGASKGN